MLFFQSRIAETKVGWSALKECGRPANLRRSGKGVWATRPLILIVPWAGRPRSFTVLWAGRPRSFIVPWAGRPRSYTDRTDALVLPKLWADCQAEYFLRMVIDFGQEL